MHLYIIIFSLVQVSLAATARPNQRGCDFSLARGATDPADVIENLEGQRREAIRQVARQESTRDQIDAKIKVAVQQMHVVLDDQVIAAITQHREGRREPASYQGCRWDDSENEKGPPPEFCYRPAHIDAWHKLIRPGGLVSETICDYRIGTWEGQPPIDQSDRCRRGLSDYFAREAEWDQVESAINILNDQIAANKTGIERLNIARTESPDDVLSLGPSPHDAYAAELSGYAGIYRGQYGMVPGAMERGSFGCHSNTPTP